MSGRNKQFNPDIGKYTQFKPGQSGNPEGKPKGVKDRATLLRKWTELGAKVTNPETDKEENGTVEDMIAIALIKKAISGDVQAIKEVNDTLYGKIISNHDVTTQGEKITAPIIGMSIKNESETD